MLYLAKFTKYPLEKHVNLRFRVKYTRFVVGHKRGCGSDRCVKKRKMQSKWSYTRAVDVPNFFGYSLWQIPGLLKLWWNTEKEVHGLEDLCQTASVGSVELPVIRDCWLLETFVLTTNAR